MIADYAILEFKNNILWQNWLDINHSKIPGIWLRLYKKDSKIQSVTYEQAVDNALCYGWIDGQRKKYDELSFLQKFTPRREKSIWSKKNIQNVLRLEKQGKIKPSGKTQIERAKQDGRWEASYDSQANMVVPEDFLKAVRQNKQVQKFYNTLNRGSIFLICMQLQTAKKPETREKRFIKLLKMLENGEKPI